MNAKMDEWKGLCEASSGLFSRAAESVWVTLPSETAGDVSMLSQYLGCDYQLLPHLHVVASSARTKVPDPEY